MLEKIMTTQNTAAMLIDMQKAYTSEVDPEVLRDMITAQLGVLNFCREYDLPLVIAELFPKKCDDRRKQGRTEDTLRILASHVPRYLYVEKARNSALSMDSHQQLQDWNVEYLILMGLNANACVWSTAVEAIHNQYEICTARDLIANPAKSKFNFRLSIYNEHALFDTHEQLLEAIK